MEEAIKKGSEVKVTWSMQTNGDNAQISWFEPLKVWAVSSRNVCLLAGSAEQVKKMYPEESRYYLARKIALSWFGTLAKMDKALLPALQKELKDKTLIGDYVGDSELVQYVQY